MLYRIIHRGLQVAEYADASRAIQEAMTLEARGYSNWDIRVIDEEQKIIWQSAN